MKDVNQKGSKPEVIIAGSRSLLPSFLKKPLFFIPVILIILTLSFAILSYFNILPLSKLSSPSQTSTQIPTKGKALHPEEPILLPTSSSTKSSTPSNQKQR